MRSGRLLDPLVAIVLVGALVVSGCSGEDDEKPSGEKDGASSSEAGTDARLGKVRGKLGKARADKVLDDVTALVEQWSDTAYAGAGSTRPKGAFADFSRDARALAAKQSALSNARVKGDIGEASIAERRVRLDVLAPGGKVAGATARVRIEVELPGLERTDLVTGRLLLTPVKGGWKVFGFDVRRGQGGA